MGIFGFELLEEQAGLAAKTSAEEWVSQFSFCRNDPQSQVWGDSEIEKLFYLALSARVLFGQHEYRRLLTIEGDLDLSASLDPTHLYVKRQVQVTDNWRVDFILFAYDSTGRVLKAPGWRLLIIECDGHEFHERTKEQAKRDRSRDREATLAGREVMRFTGSELWRDPWSCAGEALEWASRSFG